MTLPKFQIENNNVLNIVLSGVGGQGILLASDIIAEVAMNNGFSSKKSEVHGMAQRGGSVISQIRYGETVYSPLIARGNADILIAFEKLEALRYLENLRHDGVLIYNIQQITPLSVFFSDVDYPKNIRDLCKERTSQVFSIDAIAAAEQLGNLKILNTIMLGALSNLLEFTLDSWMDVIKQRVPSKTIDLNKIAFIKGRELGLDEHD